MTLSMPLYVFPIFWARTVMAPWSGCSTNTERTPHVSLHFSPCSEIALWKCLIWNAWPDYYDMALSLRAAGLWSQHKPNPPGVWACVHPTLGWGWAALGYRCQAQWYPAHSRKHILQFCKGDVAQGNLSAVTHSDTTYHSISTDTALKCTALPWN